MTLRVDSQALAPPVASRQSKEPRGEPPPDPGGGFAHLLAAWTAVAEGRDRAGDTAASAAGEAAAEGVRGPGERGVAAPVEQATGTGWPRGEAPEERAATGASGAPAACTGAGPAAAQCSSLAAGDPGSGERRSPGTGASALPAQPQVAPAGEPRVAPTGQPQRVATGEPKGVATGEPPALSGAGLSALPAGAASPAGVPAPGGAAGQQRPAAPPTQLPAAGASDGAAGRPSVVPSDEPPAAGEHAAAPPSAADTSGSAQPPQSPRQSPAPPPAGVTATDGAQPAPAAPPGAHPAPESPPTAASDRQHRAPQTTAGARDKSAETTVAERPAAAAGDGAAASTAGAATSSAGAATSGAGTTPSAGGPSVAPPPHQRLFEAARTAVWTLATRGGQHARLRLRPPTLGELEVRLHERAGGLEVRIVASEESSARALAATADQLRRALERHDLRVATVEVETAPASSLGSGAPSERQGADGRSPTGAPAEGQAASNAALRLASGEGEEQAPEATARTVVVARGFVIDVLA